MRSTHWSAALVVAFMFIVVVESASAAILNIPADYQTIQAGINAARAGDTVLVQPGMYRNTLRVRSKNIVIASLVLTTGDLRYLDSTIIDGNGNGTVVTFSGRGDTSSLKGFTVQGGLAVYGGGVYVDSSANPLLEDLHIWDNEGSQNGGGVAVHMATVRMRRVEIERNRASLGGGIYGEYSSDIRMEGGSIHNNDATVTAGGIYLYGAKVYLSRVLVMQNHASSECGGIHSFGPVDEDAVVLENVTVAENRSDREEMADGLTIYMPREESRSRIINSIFWGNTALEIAVIGQAPQGYLTISYTDVDGGQDGLRAADEGVIRIGEGFINEDPAFVNPNERDYHLSFQSPCVDAGDPAWEEDWDGTRADLGAYAVNQFRSYLGGVVLSSASGEPIAGAVIFGTSEHGFIIISDTTDNDGLWGKWFDMVDDTTLVHLRFSAHGFLTSSFDVEVTEDDSLTLETRLDFAAMIISADTLRFEVDSGAVRNVGLTIENNGNGALHWSADAHTVGDGGFNAWVVRSELPVAQTTQDDRIDGVAFADGHFYCSGANGDNPNTIYVLDRDGNQVRSFAQLGNSRYGMRDIEWDGELLWGSGEERVYGFDTDGDSVTRFNGPFNPTTCIAYDSDDGLLWLSGTTTNIAAYDRAGNPTDRVLNRRGMRIYGLAYWPEDPDGYNLYILSTPTQGIQQIYKMNTNTGDTMLAHQFLPDSISAPGGTFIFRDYDRYYNWVFAMVNNIPPNDGGDEVSVLQLGLNDEWLTVRPGSGDLVAGANVQLEITVRTVAEDSSWTFTTGEYEGEVVIEHDGQDGQVVVPVYLTVTEPNTIPESRLPYPTLFGITSSYPSPFNSTLTASYRLEQAGRMKLSLVDLTGRELRVLDEGFREAGERRVAIEVPDLPSGVYYMKLSAGVGTHVAKVVCLK